MKLSRLFLIILLIGIFFVPEQNIVNATLFNSKKRLMNSTNFSTWLWNTNEIINNSDNIIDFLSENKVKTLYLQIDYNLDYDHYNNFINKAYENNIIVEALDGSPAWVSPDGTLLQNNFFHWLNDYQKNSPINARFKGVHLDVEPYGYDEYNINQDEVISRFQDCLLKSKDICNQLNLNLAIDIPFWFNEVEFNTSYGNGNLAEWIFKNIKSISIMSYRDTANGDNGIIKITKNEINLAKRYNVKSTLAIETTDVNDGTHLTFFDQGQNYMYKELNKVYLNYKTNSSFNGFSIHSLESWINMKS
ncbi:hypothetical protein NNC19_08310 [Clostridium sp. SHJSY1]|uniref:hypothetical protein n=1 Tax=Clostridium sp. SHJSY1 TaxID=2942483 RepID=UPI0028755AA3|nr:hypothetical protein [Clostridium sp. SHJSY1]MDS0525678.1 hypothetical protein [Clostridium sp. SHJSY1]